MSTEHPIIRRAEDDFEPTKKYKYGQMAREWLEWTMHSQQIHLQHQHNGKEHRVGSRNIPVDGWDAQNKTINQFHGCIFHGHPCHVTLGMTHNPVNGEPLDELFENTKKMTNYFRYILKLNVIEQWECEWTTEKRQNPNIMTFLQAHPAFDKMNDPFRNEAIINKDVILEQVKNGTLFGMVQCDIHVPDTEEMRKKFEEMTPIFKNIEVGREHIGDFMKAYAEENKLLSQPRKTLIGSYHGHQILLATPLLKWYLDHGLEVTDIQLVAEFKPNACFKAFGDSVSDARRQGDQDPDKAILAESAKLLGNS